MFPEEPNPENFDQAAEPDEVNQNPYEEDTDPTDRPKRNCGRTGPTSSHGRATSARNATRHGLCAKTLILTARGETQEEFNGVLEMWLNQYENPADNTVLYSLIHKVAEAEWLRRRAQYEYDHFIGNHSSAPITCYTPDERKDFDLVTRYLTTGERRLQRDHRLLEQHWKSHFKPQPEPKQPAPKPAEKQPDPEPSRPKIRTRFSNRQTGESVDSQGNEYPAPPGFVPKPFMPGVYDPDHPAYEGPPLKSRL